MKDDEKDKLDADGLLDSIKKGTESANEIRRERGWAELHVTGWYQPPKYNPKTNNVEWAISGISGNSPVVNFNTRLLGRYGVMEVSLVGVGGVFGGEADSRKALTEKARLQLGADNNPLPACCPNNPGFRSFLGDWIHSACATGADAVFWDEPHFFAGNEAPASGMLLRAL